MITNIDIIVFERKIYCYTYIALNVFSGAVFETLFRCNGSLQETV